jgi:hypothetical protein
MLRSLALVLPMLPLLCVWLTACAPPSKGWSKPGTTAEQFGRDNYACAQKHSHEGSVRKELHRACMTSLGYLRVDGGQFPGVGD